MLGGAIALALLILPVIIITTREAVRAVPREIRRRLAGPGRHRVADDLAADAALGGPRHRDRHDPRACPARSARRRRCSCIGSPARSGSTPTGLLSPITALPMQIYSLDLAVAGGVPDRPPSAAIIVLLVMILGLNALAIFIRNKFQRTW